MLLQEQALSGQIGHVTELLPKNEATAIRGTLLATADSAAMLALRIRHTLNDVSPLKIAVVGDYSAGKSSFINHLLEDDSLCPVRDDPTTSHVTVFGYSPVERIVRKTSAGRSTKLTRQLYSEQVQSTGKGRSRGKPSRFIIGAPISILQGIELFDTPGFHNLTNASDTITSESVLDEIDTVLYLVDVNTGTIPDSGLQRLRKIRAHLPQAAIRVMLTKSDTKAPSRLQSLKDDCQQKHGLLFDGPVLAYSTRVLQKRAEISSREAMSALFQQMAADRRDQAAESLVQGIRLHLAQRQQLVSNGVSHLGALMQAYTAHAAKIVKSKVRITEQFKRLRVEMGPVYQSEVGEGLRNSFRVEEIKGTGWVFNDARIVAAVPELAAGLATFKSVRELRSRLRTEVKRLVPVQTALALEYVDLNCSAANSDTADRAQGLIQELFGHLLDRKYDYDTVAREKLQQEMNRHAASFAAELWKDWVLWIDGIYENVEEYCLTPLVQQSQARAAMLQGLLDACHALEADTAPRTQKAA